MKTQKIWSEDQQYCIGALAVFARGHHHLKGLKPFGDGVSMLWWGPDLSTYDGCDLTKLVIVAHAFGVRIHIQQGGPQSVKIVAFRRKHGDRKEMKFWEWHPDLNDLKKCVETWIEEFEKP